MTHHGPPVRPLSPPDPHPPVLPPPVSPGPGRRMYRDPDGDLIEILPVGSIRLQQSRSFLWPWFRSRFRVVLAMSDSDREVEWTYTRDTRPEAEGVQSTLIRDLCPGLGEPPPPPEPEKPGPEAFVTLAEQARKAVPSVSVSHRIPGEDAEARARESQAISARMAARRRESMEAIQHICEEALDHGTSWPDFLALIRERLGRDVSIMDDLRMRMLAPAPSPPAFGSTPFVHPR